MEAVSIRHGDLDLNLWFETIEGRKECVGVDVRPVRGKHRDPRPVTALDLRFPVAKIADRARKKAAKFLFADTGDPEWDEAPWAAGQMEAWEPKKPGRPPMYGPEHFAKVAQVYRQAYLDHKTPTRIVARHFKTTQSAAAKWVARCRQLGLLPKTERGVARIDPKRKGKR